MLYYSTEICIIHKQFICVIRNSISYGINIILEIIKVQALNLL